MSAVLHVGSFAGRFLHGFSIEIRCQAGMLWLNDMASKEMRGRLQSVLMVLLNCGAIITYASGLFMTWKSYAIFNGKAGMQFLFPSL